MSMEQSKPYEPSGEEIKKAEDTMDNEQEVMSEEREILAENETSQNPHTPEQRAEYEHYMYLRKAIAREGITFGSNIEISYEDNRQATKGKFNGFGIATLAILDSQGNHETIETSEISDIRLKQDLA